MPTLIGTATKPNGAGGWEDWSSTYNQAAELLAMPERGRIVQVGFWTAGRTNSCTGYGCVWDGATGDLLAQSAALTIAGRPPASGNVDLYVVDILVPPELDDAATFYAGFSRDPNRGHQLTGGASGGGDHYDRKRTAWPGSMAGADHGGHVGPGSAYRIGCHAYYEPSAGAYVARGAVRVRADQVAVRRGAGWSEADRVAARRGGAWVDAD